MKKALKKLRMSYWRLKYIKIPVRYEKLTGRANPNRSSIKSVHQTSASSRSNSWAIVLMWSPDGSIKATFLNLLIALRDCNVNILLVCNHELTNNQVGKLTQFANLIVIRDNQGFDIGGYKDCFNYLHEKSYKVDQLGFFNDSIFYGSRGTHQAIQTMFAGKADVTAFMENWEIHHHFQSFGIVISQKLFNNPSIVRFWAEYAPVSNRVHAINKGEVKFSDLLRKEMLSSFVLFSGEKLEHAIKEDLESGAAISKKFELTWVPTRAETTVHIHSQPLRKLFHEIEGFEVDHLEKLKLKLYNFIEYARGKNLSHVAPVFISKYLECPFIKKDIVYRDTFDYSQIIRILQTDFDESEFNEIRTHLQKKGLGKQLSGTKKKKYLVCAL